MIEVGSLVQLNNRFGLVVSMMGIAENPTLVVRFRFHNRAISSADVKIHSKKVIPIERNSSNYIQYLMGE